MASERITITLPEKLAKRVRQQAKKSGKPVSRVIADALQREDVDADRRRLIEGYIATREENRKFAEEALPLFMEVIKASER